MSGKYLTRVESVRRCGTDVVFLLLGRPEGFDFTPGQWLRLTLPTAEGERTETFTNTTAPGDDWLEIATRISGSPFKVALERLAPGDEVEVVGPGGRLRMPPDVTEVAFLIGGVGVTPARSMLRDAMQRGHRFRDGVVFYGNRDATCTPYLEELAAMASSGVRVVSVLEHPDEQWEGERGFVTSELVRRHADISDGRLVFVSGPPPMVEAMQSVLDDLGVAQERRRIEWFGTPTRAGLG